MGVTQCDRILRHMKDYGSITSDEAKELYGVARLASRINDLRAQGVEIATETVTGKNRYGRKTRYARYRLAEEGDNHEANGD